MGTVSVDSRLSKDDPVVRTGLLVTQWRVLAVITLLAATLDLFRLSAQPIWFDEVASITAARLTLGEFFSSVGNRDAFMYLYEFLLRIPLVFGQSEFAVRSLSVIFAVAAVPSMYLLGRRLFDDRTAAVTALLLAANSLFIDRAQEARSYTLTTLVVIWSWYTLLNLVERPGWARTTYYSLLTGALAYCHVLSLLMLPAQWAALSVLRPGRRILKFVAASVLFIGILSVPMTAFMLPAAMSWYGLSYQQTIAPRPSKIELQELTLRFVNLPVNVGPLPHFRILLAVATIVLVALPFAGVASCMRGMDRKKLFGYSCGAFSVIFPVAALLIASFLTPHRYYNLRYIVPSLPFFLLLLAAGLNEARPAMMKVGFGLLLVANCFGTLEYYRTPTKPDWRSAVEYLIPRIRRDDKLALIPWQARCSFDYNLSRLSGSLPPAAIVFPLTTGFLVPSSTDEMLAAVAPTYSRLWIIFEDPGPPRNKVPKQILEDLGKRYPYHRRRDFWRLSVFFYALKDHETVASATGDRRRTDPTD